MAYFPIAESQVVVTRGQQHNLRYLGVLNEIATRYAERSKYSSLDFTAIAVCLVATRYPVRREKSILVWEGFLLSGYTVRGEKYN